MDATPVMSDRRRAIAPGSYSFQFRFSVKKEKEVFS